MSHLIVLQLFCLFPETPSKLESRHTITTTGKKQRVGQRRPIVKLQICPSPLWANGQVSTYGWFPLMEKCSFAVTAVSVDIILRTSFPTIHTLRKETRDILHFHLSNFIFHQKGLEWNSCVEFDLFHVSQIRDDIFTKGHVMLINSAAPAAVFCLH